MNVIQKNSEMQSLKYYKAERDSLFSTCTLAGDKIYAFTNYKRLPVVWNKKTKEMILISDLKGYDASFCADGMINYRDNIFALELNGKRLLKFDIYEKICRYYDINCGQEKWGNYVSYAKYGNYFYVFPKYVNKLIKVNLDSGELSTDIIPYFQESKRNIMTRNSFELFECGCQSESGDIMWLFSKYGNFVIAYNMKNGNWERHELDLKIMRCMHAMQYNKKIYILSVEGKIYSWNITDKCVEEIADCSSKNVNRNTFLRIAVTDKNIYLLPSLSEDIFCINVYTKQVSKYEFYPSEFRNWGNKAWSKFYGYCEDEHNYYFAMRCNNYMLSINKRNGQEIWIKPKLPSEDDFIKTYIKYNNKISDEAECTLKGMMMYVKSDYMSNLNMAYQPVGENIWELLK